MRHTHFQTFEMSSMEDTHTKIVLNNMFFCRKWSVEAPPETAKKNRILQKEGTGRHTPVWCFFNLSRH